MEEHSNELTTEELQHLQAAEEKNLAEDMSSEGRGNGNRKSQVRRLKKCLLSGGN